MFLLVVQSFVTRSMLVVNLYRVPQHFVPPSLRRCSIALLVEPKSLRLLLMSGGIPLGFILLLVGYLCHSPHRFGEVLLTYSVPV